MSNNEKKLGHDVFFFFVSRPNFLGNQCERAKKTNKPAKKKKKKRITIVHEHPRWRPLTSYKKEMEDV